ncbi:hypothetical protein OsJ_34846 [Oryza sativa Japonica Group]|uniref:Uncharacterized protein n=1 Tax=Oryza sativa subsp. japonica TaxID=39947 RepID=A3CDZ1_ORYSJ|nr:hypothetical protein OsJ_34846 [Oryza sativa Japonica Group]
MAFTVLALAVVAVSGAAAAWTTTFTMHNLCPYTVWPLVTPNAGQPAIITGGATIRLDPNGLASLAFPAAAGWSGRVVPRTGCTGAATCATGDAPPATVAQVSVNAAGGLAEYSVSPGRRLQRAGDDHAARVRREPDVPGAGVRRGHQRGVPRGRQGRRRVQGLAAVLQGDVPRGEDDGDRRGGDAAEVLRPRRAQGRLLPNQLND